MSERVIEKSEVFQDPNEFDEESEFEDEEYETQFEKTGNIDLTASHPLLMCRNCDYLHICIYRTINRTHEDP